MLHIINKSPNERSSLFSCLRVAQGGALLLIEDGVLAALRDQPNSERVREAMTRFKVYALGPDLEARGVADRVLDGVQAIDYGGFVDLVVEHRASHSWL